MIEVFKIKLLTGRYLATGVYSNRGVPAFSSKITANEVQADNVLKAMKKDVLRKKITTYLNHRNQIMDNFGGLRTPERLKVFQALRNNFDYLFDKSLEHNCRFVLINEDYLRLLLPGRTSRFYESTRQTIEEIITFCKTNNQ